MKKWTTKKSDADVRWAEIHEYQTTNIIDGTLLTIFELYINTADDQQGYDMQESFELAREIAFEEFNVPLDAWREVTEPEL